MINPFRLLLGRQPCVRAAIWTLALLLGSQSSFAASAQTYPISGVWVAMDQRFMMSKAGACLTLKRLGADALFEGPFPTVMIFSVRERLVVRGGRAAELAIQSVKSVNDGSFHITESLGKIPWFKTRTLRVKVVDPMLIEVTEGAVSTRFFKCSSDSRSL